MGWPYPPDHANLLAIPFNQGQVVLDLLVDAQATQDLKKAAAHGMLAAVEQAAGRAHGFGGFLKRTPGLLVAAPGRAGPIAAFRYR